MRIRRVNIHLKLTLDDRFLTCRREDSLILPRYVKLSETSGADGEVFRRLTNIHNTNNALADP